MILSISHVIIFQGDRSAMGQRPHGQKIPQCVPAYHQLSVYDTIRPDTLGPRSTCAQKLIASQLNLSHWTKKWKRI